MPVRELRVARDDSQLFLAGKDLLAQLVPALIELALVLVDPFFGYLVRGVGVAPGAKYMKKGLSGISAFCWRTHLIALVGHVLRKVVALLGVLRRLDGCRALVLSRGNTDWFLRR